MAMKPNKFSCYLVSALLLSIVANVSQAADVIDGDTIKQDGTTYRLWGLDAPEIGQQCEYRDNYYDCGELAKMGLTAFLGDDAVTCEKVNTDRYKRLVARCAVEGLDIGSWLVSNGLAVDYPRYSKGYYKTEQDAAEEGEKGIWSGDFTLPWEWREERR